MRGNVERDGKVNRELEALGWRVLRVWEHEIERNVDDVVECVRELIAIH